MSNSDAHRRPDQDQLSSPLYLGFDLSTQQLKVIVLHLEKSRRLETHSSFAVQFDSDLPHHNTRGGVTVDKNESNYDGDKNDSKGVVTTPVLMWVEALELVLDIMKKSGFPFERVQAISGAAQQHGSVYWSSRAKETFEAMESPSNQSSLKDLFKDAFMLQQSPIWQDTSTTAQCQEIEQYLGSLDQEHPVQEVGREQETAETLQLRLCGQQRLAELTGSRAYERYTGSQILKIVQRSPDVYAATERISLVSSFLASLLMAQYGMIDVADGSGMNLLNIETKTWDPLLTKFIGQGGAKGQVRDADAEDTLAKKLGELDASGKKVQGVLSGWFVRRYGFRSDVSIVTFTGDNPATVMAMRAEPGDAIVSLGTSDTLLLYTDNHVSPSALPKLTTNKVEEQRGDGGNQANARLSVGYLCHPVDPNGYLMLYCAKNGSLAREQIRNTYADHDWVRFDEYLTEACNKSNSIHGNDKEQVGFYFFDREIWPPVEGVHRFEDGKPVEEFGEDKEKANVLAICESQFLAMRIRSSQKQDIYSSMASTPAPSQTLSLRPPGISRILATGGASSNISILQLLSNVFGVPVVSAANQNEEKGTGSAAWGAARKAFLYGSSQAGRAGSEEESQNSGIRAGESTSDEARAIMPDLERTSTYVARMSEFVRLEGTLLRQDQEA